jgi:hypothetical protein
MAKALMLLASALPALADGVENLMIGRNGQKGGMLDLRRQADSRQRARRQIEAEGFDVLFARADEDQFLLGLRAPAGTRPSRTAMTPKAIGGGVSIS